MIKAWEDDPVSARLEEPPPPNVPVERSEPGLGQGSLPVNIADGQPPAGDHDPGTPEFRYWAAAEALSRASQFWASVLPGGTSWQESNGNELVATLDEGEDFNAYYDRNGLHFFHGTVRGHTVFSGESPDVVCHELGHAVLDSIKPELWDAASIEAAAFHEGFADISAMLANLQLPSVREEVIRETGGRLSAASRLSRLAEQLGWAIRQLQPDGASPDCLRNAINSFYYQQPSSLAPSAPSAQLSSEPHSFSRLFSGAFLRTLAGIFTLQQRHDADALGQAATDAGRLLVEGVRRAPVVPSFYSQVAAHMVQADASLFNRRYRRAILAGFVRHGILSVRSAAEMGAAGAAERERAADGELAAVALRGVDYALDRDLRVRAASQSRHLPVAGGVSDVGDVEPQAPENAAGSFVEDLFRRGRIRAHEQIGEAPLIGPLGYKTHEIRPADEALELVRLVFDCGFAPD